ncbi:hypothetical protein [Aminobacterium colombiense]
MLPETITVETATEYFERRYGAAIWPKATEEEKAICIETAYVLLEDWQERTNESNFELAIYEEALWILEGAGESQERGVVSIGLTGISESYDLKGRPPHIAPRAWVFLKRGSSQGAVWIK